MSIEFEFYFYRLCLHVFHSPFTLHRRHENNENLARLSQITSGVKAKLLSMRCYCNQLPLAFNVQCKLNGEMIISCTWQQTSHNKLATSVTLLDRPTNKRNSPARVRFYSFFSFLCSSSPARRDRLFHKVLTFFVVAALCVAQKITMLRSLTLSSKTENF